LLLISVAALAQAAPPTRVEIDYEVTRNGMALADIEHRFEHTGGAYQVTETWRAAVCSSSAGRSGGRAAARSRRQGLQPLEYSDRRTGRDTERATFDWNAKTVTVQYQETRKPCRSRCIPRTGWLFFTSLRSFRPKLAGSPRCRRRERNFRSAI